MSNRSFRFLQFLPAAFVFLSAAVFGVASLEASQSKTNARRPEDQPTVSASPSPVAREENKKPLDSARYTYEFKQPDFVVSHIVINHDASGKGSIKFERRLTSSVIEEPIELSPAALERILSAWTALNFLESTENYQSERQYAHLGTMRLGMERESRKRSVEFNWSKNKIAFDLANEYRRVADQAVLVFDISVARESQRLNTPKLMEEFELQLKRNGLSDPQQLIPLLKDISTDEHLPLIARNHALRLIKKIEK